MFIIRGTINWLKGVLHPFALMKENSISLIVFEVLFRILTFLVLFQLYPQSDLLAGVFCYDPDAGLGDAV